ncbi:MAG: orotate phosphoribosyltransferase [Candidatus Helarchaeota archaeon]
MYDNKNPSMELIKYIIEKKGLLFGRFELKSNRVSPYFFNLANLIIDGKGLAYIAKVFAQFIEKNIGLNNFDFIFGPAYKGIPLAASICLQINNIFKVNKRWGYDRKEAKTYGDKTEKWLVGQFKDNDRILLIDDVITTGLTKIKTCEKLKNYSNISNIQFVGIVVLLDRQEKNDDGIPIKQYLSNAGLTLHSILQIKDVYKTLINMKIRGKQVITEKEYSDFKNYMEKYGV